MPFRKSRAPLISSAVWLWSRCCHQRAGMNSGRMIVTNVLRRPTLEVVEVLEERPRAASGRATVRTTSGIPLEPRLPALLHRAGVVRSGVDLDVHACGRPGRQGPRVPHRAQDASVEVAHQHEHAVGGQRRLGLGAVDRELAAPPRRSGGVTVTKATTSVGISTTTIHAPCVNFVTATITMHEPVVMAPDRSGPRPPDHPARLTAAAQPVGGPCSACLRA